MLDYLHLSSEGMNARIIRQQVIANNLANVNTVGYKKDRAFHQVLNIANVNAGIEYEETTVFEEGFLRETGEPLDFSLKGDGFFIVQTENGNRYTRNGKFEIDEDGQLVMPEVGPIMGEGGPIILTKDFEVNEKGEFLVDNMPVGKLKLVSFEDNSVLKKEGNSLFFYDEDNDDVIEMDATNVMIQQGYLEDSNVNAIEEMVNMIMLYREFEADQKALHTFDNVMDENANRIGKV